MKINRIILLLLAVLLLISLFTSCSKVEEEPALEETHETVPAEEPKPVEKENTEPIKPVEVPKEEKKVEVPKYTNPLTGEETQEDITKFRPVAVMQNNIEAAMPQLGVSQADILFEVPVEAGITRCLGVYENIENVPVLGSIRSSRHYYLDLVQSLDAIYIHAGGSPYAYDYLSSRGIDHVDGVNGDGGIFYRDEDRLATMALEHTMCAHGEDISNYIRTVFSTVHKNDYQCNLKFTDKPAMVEGIEGSYIEVSFGGGKYTYFDFNSTDGLYYASQYGTEYIDGNNDEQLKFKNIIVIQTDIWTLDEKDRKDMTLTGEGTGYYVCDGKLCEINWSREDWNSQFVFTYADGTPLEFGIGHSYYAIISQNGYVESITE